MQSQTITLKSALEEHYPGLDIGCTHTLLPFLVKHGAWLHNHFAQQGLTLNLILGTLISGEGGTILQMSSNPTVSADPYLPYVAAPGSLSYNNNIKIDGITPYIVKTDFRYVGVQRYVGQGRVCARMVPQADGQN